MPETIVCPLVDCHWTLDATPPEVDPGALASVFGFGVFSAVAAHQHQYRVETELRAHFRGHSLEDFLRTITSLRQQRDEALRALEYAASGEAVSPP